MVRSLLDRHWYDAVASLLAGSRTGPEARAAALARVARRVLDLDAEDFGAVAAQYDRPWADRLTDSAFPIEPRDERRGALGSLVPLYELMLEVLDLRAARGEPLQVVVTAHLIGEFLAQLAWETRLGHAGDPMRMAADVGGRWGSEDRRCPHSSAQRATARRALNACDGDRVGYTAYLDRFHSRLGDALAVCAMNHRTVAAGERPEVAQTCPNPCGFALEGDLAARRDLDARVRLALLYVESPLVALRHHAPVGHFFGVPSTAEISRAWVQTWERLSQPWADGCNPLLLDGPPGRPEPEEALPGMSALVSAVAGRTIGPGRVLRELGADIRAALDEEL
nr:hypothetical protein [Auraticoccus cholistanensis]